MLRRILAPALVLAWLAFLAPSAGAQTRLLRQPTLSATRVAFTCGSELWIAERRGVARRLS